MKVDLADLKVRGMRNLFASVELLKALEVIEQFLPPPVKVVKAPEEENRDKFLKKWVRKQLPEKTQKKKRKMTPARLRQLRNNAQKTQAILRSLRRLCPVCKEKKDPRAFKRHVVACRRRHNKVRLTAVKNAA